MLKAPLEITTDRLVLSRPQLADAEEIFSRYASDVDVTRYLGWPRHSESDDSRCFVRFSDDQWDKEGIGPYLIWRRHDECLVGSTGLHITAPGQGMTGYVLAKDAWGVGYATEVLLAITNLAVELKFRRIYGFSHPQHVASLRVFEKCGFVRDVKETMQIEFPNLEPGVKQDAWCYAKEF